jgi:hypothetical protein
MKFVLLFRVTLLASLVSLLLISCQRNDNNKSSARLQVRLTDNPAPDVKAVWVDIQQVEVMVNDNAYLLSPAAIHSGVYNLLDFTNGKDTLLADAEIPTGTISQIRLILGVNNYIVTSSGEKISLNTPSAQQSGLKVQVHQQTDGGVLYRLILDFDAARSIVKAGNSGKYNLKPVIRILSFAPSGGNLKGVVTPDSIQTVIMAINGSDTAATTFTDFAGNYLLKDIPAGNYVLAFIPSDTMYKTTEKNAIVVLGQTTVIDTVHLQP